MNIRVVNFKPKFTIRGYPIQKKAQRFKLELPYAAQILSAEDQSHEGTLMLWVMENADPNLPKVPRDFLVTQEGVPFDFEGTVLTPDPLSSDGEISSGSGAPVIVQHVGMWVDRTLDQDGVVAVTGHILEIIPIEED